MKTKIRKISFFVRLVLAVCLLCGIGVVYAGWVFAGGASEDDTGNFTVVATNWVNGGWEETEQGGTGGGHASD